MLVLGLNETLGKLAMKNSVHLCGYVLRRKDGQVLRSALEFEVEVQRKKGRPKRTWKKQVEDESVNVGLRKGKCTLLIRVESWRKSDFCWVEVNLATHACPGYHQIINIGFSQYMCVHVAQTCVTTTMTIHSKPTSNVKLPKFANTSNVILVKLGTQCLM